jgi:hypothetical protein
MSATNESDMRIDDPEWFATCVHAAMLNLGFVAEFERLTGRVLVGIGRSPIERMVDDATGRTDAAMQAFVRTVYDVVYSRVPRTAAE